MFRDYTQFLNRQERIEIIADGILDEARICICGAPMGMSRDSIDGIGFKQFSCTDIECGNVYEE